MKKFILILIMCNSLTNAIAMDYEKVEITNRCSLLDNELAISMNATDWNSFREITMWGIKNCKNIRSRDEYYILYSNLSIVERENGRYAKAIEFAKECIKNRYGIPACHVELAASSIKFNDKKISVEYIAQAKAVLKHAIADNKKLLLIENKEYQRELLQAQLEDYDAMLRYIEIIEK